MKDIFIIGAGGFAKEVHFLIRETKQFNIKAFVDKERGNSIRIAGIDTEIISEIELIENKGSCLAFGIGDPKLVYKLTEKFKNDFEFPNLIHPNLVADRSGLKMGMGNIICSGVNFTTDINIGSFNIFNLCCTLGHDTLIGNCNVFNPGCNISGGVTLEDNILVGTNATILQYLKIGKNSIVGAASLVTKDVEENCTVIGIPAKKII